MFDYNLMDDDQDESELNVQGSFVAICKQAVLDSSDAFCSVDDFLEALNKTL